MFKYANLISQNHIQYHTIQFWESTLEYDWKSKEESIIPKPYGTGVLLKHMGKHFILSAKHVLEDISNENPIYFRYGANELQSIRGEVGMIEDEKNLDIGFIELADDIVNVINGIQNLKFLTSEDVAYGFELDKDQTLIACGFMESKSRVDKNSFDITAVQSCQILSHVRDKVYKFSKYTKQTRIGLSIHGKQTTIDGEKKIKKVEPNGMSGGGVWIVWTEKFLDEMLFRYHLIGILTEFNNNKYNVMWATRIEYLMNGINKSYGFETLIGSTKT